MAKEKYTATQVIDAIDKSQGIIKHAARLLNCSRRTIHNYIERYPSVADAYEDTNEGMIDYVESKLIEQISVGNTTAIIFYLKTKAKHRGYAERTEVTGADGKPIQTQQTNVNLQAESAHDANNILKQLAELGAIPSEPGTSDNHTTTE